MWKILLSLISGPLSSISNDLKQAYQAKLDAANDAERLAADERINLLEARKSIILAAQSDPVERWVRIGFSVPFVLYVNKVVIWDKVLGWGVTDGLSDNFTNIMMMILGGYFLQTAIQRFKNGR